MSNITYINQLLEKMVSVDKDYRFMATNDLMTELRKDSIKWDDDGEKKIMSMLLNQLKDKNSEVQNLAVKCLGVLIQKVKENKIQYITHALCLNVLSENEQLRDISSVGLKTVISELSLMSVSTQTTKTICDDVIDTLTKSIQKEDFSIQLEILDVCADLFARSGTFFVTYDNIILTIFLPLLRSPRQAIRKRAIVVLSRQTLLCNPELFEKLMNYLCTECLSPVNVSVNITIIQCIVAICRQAGHKFGKYIERIIVLINGNEFFNENDELRDHCLQAFEVFVIQCQKEMQQYVPEIIKLCLKLISYDPNYIQDYDDHDKDHDKDDEENDFIDDTDSDDYDDDEDISWKVRKSAARCLQAIITTRSELLSVFYNVVSPVLIARFREREENVRSDIFQAYIALLKQTKVNSFEFKLENKQQNEIPIFMLEAQVSSIVEALQSLIKDKNIKTRQDCFNLLKEIASILPGSLSCHMPVIISGILHSLDDKNSNSTIKINTLTFIHHLMNTHPPDVFYPYMKALIGPIITAVKDSFYKISAEGLLVIEKIVTVIRPVDSLTSFDCREFVNDVYDCTFMHFKETGIDQEVKERAILCMGQVIANLGDYLQERKFSYLPIFLDRLKNEITRLTTLKALGMIAASPIHIDFFIINEAIPIIGSFLHKNKRILKLNAMLLLDNLVQNYSQTIETNVLYDLLNDISTEIKDSDLQMVKLCLTFLTSIANFHPAALVNVSNSILPEIFILLKSPLLQGSALESMTKFFEALIRCNLPGLDHHELLKMLINIVIENSQILHKQAFNSLAKCVAVVSISCEQNAVMVVAKFMEDIVNGKDNDTQHIFALLAIGEIGRHVDLSSLDDLKLLILNSFTHINEDVKLAACFAFGNIAIGNLSYYLPFVLEIIDNYPKKLYLLLNSLKEIITCQSTTREDVEKLLPFIPKIWSLLFKQCECNEEGTRNLVAECLGKLTLIDPQKLLPSLEESLNSPSPLIRTTVVMAIKFTISDQPQPIDEMLQNCMVPLINMLNDSDLNVRKVTLITINSVVHYKAFLIRNLLHIVLPKLYNATVIQKELIRELEIGPFKHQVDDGLDLRKSAFVCMNTLLDSCVDKLDIYEFLTYLECGLRDDYNIKILTYLIAARLAQLCPHAVLQRIETLIEPLRKTFDARVKADAIVQEQQKQEELKRSAMRTVVTWLSIPEIDKNMYFSNLIIQIQSNRELNPLFVSIQKELKGDPDCLIMDQSF